MVSVTLILSRQSASHESVMAVCRKLIKTQSFEIEFIAASIFNAICQQKLFVKSKTGVSNSMTTNKLECVHMCSDD